MSQAIPAGARAPYSSCGRNDAPDHIQLDPLYEVVRAGPVESGPKSVNDN